MDAFSLTNRKRLSFCMTCGFICALIAFLLEDRVIPNSPLIGAIDAELLKGIPILYLVMTRKIVMMGDATIYGSAVGAGFAIGENIHIVYYAIMSNSISHGMAILLGFEAAVMHIGCSSLLAYGLIIAKQESTGTSYIKRNLAVVTVFVITITIHFIHDVVPINPLILTPILVLYFVFSKYHLFKKNEKTIHNWIDQCLNNDVVLLASIKKGELAKTNAGKYLLSIKDAFPPEVFFDICCYISEYLELSITAKSNLILHGAGFPIQHKEENEARVSELKALRKRIGKAGIQAVSPIVNIDDVDRWAMQALL
jgi:hypothetical protein